MGHQWDKEVRAYIVPDRSVLMALRWITNGTFADYFTVGCKTEVSYARS